MWKAAFTGRSESGSGSGERRKPKSHRAESLTSTVSTARIAGEDRIQRLNRSIRGNVFTGDDGTTGNAVQALDDDDEWEEDGDGRKKTMKPGRNDDAREQRRNDDTREQRRKSKSEKESRDDEKSQKRRGSESHRHHRHHHEDSERSAETSTKSEKARGKARAEESMETSRALPAMGSFEQFPGQHSEAPVGPVPPQEPHTTSGAIPSAVPHSQFSNQDPNTYAHSQFEPNGLSRADSFGAAADYYLDEGQSVATQPGVRPLTPNMLVNPNQHLMAASAEAHPAEDTGHGSAADFYSGKVSPVSYEASSVPSSGKPSNPSRQSSGSSRKPSKLGRISSTTAAAAVTAGALGVMDGARHSKTNQTSSTSSHQQTSEKMYKPTRYNSEPTAISSAGNYSAPSQHSQTYQGPPGKQPVSTAKSNIPLYAAGVAAAGLATQGMNQHHSQQSSFHTAGRSVGDHDPPRAPPSPLSAGRSYINAPPSGMGQDYHFHEQKGPMTRLKDGLLSLISDPEDVAKMEMYTEYIGVCKYCFDPRTSPHDAPRKHHYHKRRDSFEDLRKRRSMERMNRMGSTEWLRRNGSQRVDKETRYTYSDSAKRRKTNTRDVLGAGLAAVGVAAGAINDRKDFDDTYSIKSGHREASAVRRRSRSSSRERRRRSTRGVIGKAGDRNEEVVTVRMKDGSMEKRRVLHRSRSRSKDRIDRPSTVSGAASGAAFGVGAASAMATRSKHRGESEVQGAWVRHGSRSGERSHGSYYDFSGHEQPERNNDTLGGFSSSSHPERRERRRSRGHRKKRTGFFNFGNASSASSDSEMAFGEGFSSKTSLPLRRKSSQRRKSDQHLAATVAGIGATAAALAAAQQGQRVSKQGSRVQLGARKLVRTSRHAEPGYRHGSHAPSDEDEWEDELPSEVDDTSSVDSGMAFGGSVLSHRQSMESLGSNDGLMSAWGWRWGSKEKKKQRTSSPPSIHRPRPNDAFVAPIGARLAAGTVASATLDAAGRPLYPPSTVTSMTSAPQQPMQHIDPRPIFDSSPRHASNPSTNDPFVTRPSPAPIQHPRPVAPQQPSFVQSPLPIDMRLKPRRTASSPVQSNFSQDAALIGGAALATAGIIASQGRKSKDATNVRFGLTEEQLRKEDRERRREREQADEVRRGADRTRALKEEAERHAKEEDARSREQGVLRAREDENRRAAEAELERHRAAQREAEEQAEMDRQRQQRQLEPHQQVDGCNREQARLAEEQRQQEQNRHRWETTGEEEVVQNEVKRKADRERQARDRKEREPHAEIERKYEPEEREQYQRNPHRADEPDDRERRNVDGGRARPEDQPQHSSSAWGPVAAGAAAATVGAVLAEREHQRNREDDSRDEGRRRQEREGDALEHPLSNDVPHQQFAAKQIVPGDEISGSPIADDDIFDRDFFRRKRTDSQQAKQAAIARRVAERVMAEEEEGRDANDVIADMDAYYSQPAPSQAEFFAPRDLLNQQPIGKTKVADAHDDQVQVVHGLDGEIQSYVDSSIRYEPRGRSMHAPYGVPGLRFTAPTPPPATPPFSQRHSSRSASPLRQIEDSKPEPEIQADTGTEKRTRKKTLSWGEDSTHVYNVPTPESFHEKDSYMTARDEPTDAVKDGTEVKDIQPDMPSSYRQPLYEPVSAVRPGIFGVDSPDTEGAPPVRGFVEGDVDDSTSAEEKTPHIPGGFEDDVSERREKETSQEARDAKRDPQSASEVLIEPPTEHVSREFEAEAKEEENEKPSVAPLEPAWESPLSKKEKKKRDKAGKQVARPYSFDSEPSTYTSEEVALPPREPAPESQKESADDTRSKKDKKKRDKALKRGLSNVSSPIVPETKGTELAEDSSAQDTILSRPGTRKLSKQEQRKLERQAKKQSFADIAGAMMTAGGIAAVAAGMSDEAEEDATRRLEDIDGGDAWSMPSKGRKGKKKQIESERDIRDMEPSQKPLVPKPASTQASSIPGSWQVEKLSQEPEEETAVSDHFQHHVRDEPDNEAENWSEFTRAKQTERDSGRLHEPAASSPVRSKNQFNDYIGNDTVKTAETASAASTMAYFNDEAGTDEATRPAAEALVKSEPRTLNEIDVASDEHSQYNNNDVSEYQGRGERYDIMNRRLTDRPHDTSTSEKGSPSIASDPTLDRDFRSRSERVAIRQEIGRDYDDGQDYNDDQSVAVSEPVDVFDEQSKRKPRHSEIGTTSVNSAPSRREKEESPTAHRGKKGGIRGLLNRNTSDTQILSLQSTWSGEAPPSKQSVRESEYGDIEHGEIVQHRRKKHWDASNQVEDDDDMRSVGSDLARNRHHERSERDEDDSNTRRDNESGRMHDHRRRTDDDELDTEVRRDEEGAHHHHRRRTDDQELSSERRRVVDGEHKRSRRRRTAEDESDNKDYSFLGRRVEDLPPLPVSQTASPVLVPVALVHGLGTLISAEPDANQGHQHSTQQAERLQAEGFVHEVSISGRYSEVTSSDSNQIQFEDGDNDLPALPASRPESPTSFEETPPRPSVPQRLTSASAVPVRFPFGHAPPQKERSTSSGSPALHTPISPIAASKKGRPTSSEIRPLYLVERNRKTPEVEELLPSLPSSKPSSRASSLHGSDEWHPTANEPPVPDHDQELAVDINLANAYRAEDDYLDSQETTPKASDFPQTAFQRSGRREPQFYTWADFEQDERLHRTIHDASQNSHNVPSSDSSIDTEAVDLSRSTEQDESHLEHFPSLPESRPDSPYDREAQYHQVNVAPAESVAAATMLGSAATPGLSWADRSDMLTSDSHAYNSMQTEDAEASSPFRRRSLKTGTVETGELQANDGLLFPASTNKQSESATQKPEPSETQTFVNAEQEVEEDYVNHSHENVLEPPNEDDSGVGAAAITGDLDRFMDIEGNAEDGSMVNDLAIADSESQELSASAHQRDFEAKDPTVKYLVLASNPLTKIDSQRTPQTAQSAEGQKVGISTNPIRKQSKKAQKKQKTMAWEASDELGPPGDALGAMNASSKLKITDVSEKARLENLDGEMAVDAQDAGTPAELNADDTAGSQGQQCSREPEPSHDTLSHATEAKSRNSFKYDQLVEDPRSPSLTVVDPSDPQNVAGPGVEEATPLVLDLNATLSRKQSKKGQKDKKKKKQQQALVFTEDTGKELPTRADSLSTAALPSILQAENVAGSSDRSMSVLNDNRFNGEIMPEKVALPQALDEGLVGVNQEYDIRGDASTNVSVTPAHSADSFQQVTDVDMADEWAGFAPKGKKGGKKSKKAKNVQLNVAPEAAPAFSAQAHATGEERDTKSADFTVDSSPGPINPTDTIAEPSAYGLSPQPAPVARQHEPNCMSEVEDSLPPLSDSPRPVDLGENEHGQDLETLKTRSVHRNQEGLEDNTVEPLLYAEEKTNDPRPPETSFNAEQDVEELQKGEIGELALNNFSEHAARMVSARTSDEPESAGFYSVKPVKKSKKKIKKGRNPTADIWEDKHVDDLSARASSNEKDLEACNSQTLQNKTGAAALASVVVSAAALADASNPKERLAGLPLEQPKEKEQKDQNTVPAVPSGTDSNESSEQAKDDAMDLRPNPQSQIPAVQHVDEEPMGPDQPSLPQGTALDPRGPESSSPEPNALREDKPASVARGLAGVQEEAWSGFRGKRSKQEKQKAKRSGHAAPTVLEEPKRLQTEPTMGNANPEPTTQPFQTDQPQFGPKSIASNGPESAQDIRVDEAARTPLPEDGPDDWLDQHTTNARQGECEPTYRAAATDELPLSHSTYDPTSAHDVGFAATVATGLADSGFDPSMVVNDQVFLHRTSPPGRVPEADPEEIFTSTTRRRKKKKEVRQIFGQETESSQYAVEALVDSHAAVSGDFDDALSQGLARAGFDSSFLQQATSSSNATGTDETANKRSDLVTLAPKRKKGKKAARLVAGEMEPDAGNNDSFSIPDAWSDLREPERAGDLLKDIPPEDGVHRRQLHDDDALQTIVHHAQLPLQDQVHIQNAFATEDTTAAPAAPLGHPTGGIVTIRDREMDVDEMDKAYSTFKKRDKRKKRKDRASAREAETSQDAGLETPEPTRDNHTNLAIVDTSVAVSAFADAADEPPSSATMVSSASRPEGFSHTPEVSQSLPVPAEKSLPPEFNDHGSLASGTSQTLDSWEEGRFLSEQDMSQSRRFSPLSKASLAITGAAAGAVDFRVASEQSEEEAVVANQLANRNAERPRANPTSLDYNREPSWSFGAIEEQLKPLPGSQIFGSKEHQVARDSGYQEASSPALRRRSVESPGREVPEIPTTQSRESLRSRRSVEPLHVSNANGSDWELKSPKNRSSDPTEAQERHGRTPSQDTPLESMTKNRASYLFQSPAVTEKGFVGTPGSPGSQVRSEQQDYFHTGLVRSNVNEFAGSYDENNNDRGALSPPTAIPMSPRGPLEAIPEEHHPAKRSKAESDVGGPKHLKALRRTETPQAIRTSRENQLQPTRPSVHIPTRSLRAASDPMPTDEVINRLSSPTVDEEHGTINISHLLKEKSSKPIPADERSPSVLSNRSHNSAGPFKSPEGIRSFSRASNHSSGPILRRTDRSLSGDLRAASLRSEAGSAVGARSSPKTIPFEPPPTPPSNDDDVIDGNAARAAEMANVFQGYGDADGSQVSPTRPPSMRKRQSMHIVDLESKLDQLTAEIRALQSAKEQTRETIIDQQDGNSGRIQGDLDAHDLQLRDKDDEINQVRTMLEPMQLEIDRLTEINAGLTEANRNLVDDTNGRYATLQSEHAHAHEQWQSASRELESMREDHGRLTNGMRDIVETEIATALADKNAELLRLREELDVATEQIRALQVQIQSSKSNDFLIIRDEDYFDGACGKLCQHVQQWVLRFSKLNDNRICRLSTDLNDEKIEGRLDNAILDGSDVDKLLGDRIRRRDVLMSVLMTMVWEYVFTRYLFGMDREQRQKLKLLEKQLAEVGPPRAVAQWRAITLTLLTKRPDFSQQCALDTEAVTNEVFGVLGALLPPPSSAEQALQASLQKVIGIAVDLSIEMRTQRAEYIMLPPLQPEYDVNGDLVRKVHFNASLMNERSGLFSTNEELEQDRAVVKLVLFPLVVKKGNEFGEGEEEVVVCPAQVLVHNDGSRGKKVVRVMSGAMEIDDPRRSRQSLVSTAPGSAAF